MKNKFLKLSLSLVILSSLLLQSTFSISATYSPQTSDINSSSTGYKSISAASKAELVGSPSKKYKLGEAFRASEVSLKIWNNNSYTILSGSQLKITANGVNIYEGYKFKEVGTKNVKVSGGGKTVSYKLQVVAKSTETIIDCYLITNPQTLTYRAHIEPFRSDEIIVRCEYANGTYEDFYGDQLNITANGNPIDGHYRFKEPGKKKVVITLKDYSTSFNINVLPSFSKAVSRCDVLQEPTTFKYRVGDPFRAYEIVVRCYYKDGTYEDFFCDRLNITVNSTSLYDGYKFKEKGQKNVVVTLGDYVHNFEITVV